MRQSFGLTPCQRDLLGYLQRYEKQHGYTPSYEEMRVALGYGSKSRVHALVVGLEERKAIQRMPGQARSIRVLEAA